MIGGREPHRATPGASWLMPLLLLAGCGQTLAFAERDGVNFSLRADGAVRPPLEINFGLNRNVGSVVPPTAEASGRPRGEAVNMFAGFQVERFGTTQIIGPLNIDLRIGTQFASGAAALAVANNPAVVRQIVTTRPIRVTEGFAEYSAAAFLQRFVDSPDATVRAQRQQVVRQAASSAGVSGVAVPQLITNPAPSDAERRQVEQIARQLGWRE